MSKHNRIGLVGLGLMGSSITACLLASGHHVVAVVPKLETEPKTRINVLSYIQQLAEEAELTAPPEELMKNFIITDDLYHLKGLGLVIECITEDVDDKKILFSNLEEILTFDAIIASNTSAIPITRLQSGMKNPERLMGLHWAEPAHISKFMEIICGDQSEPGLATELMELAASWGKEPSLVKKDIRGFISNRMMYALIREGLSLVENGYASIEDIDKACRNDIGQWITFAGPFRFMDLTGIHAYVKVMAELFPELSNMERVPDSVNKLISEGKNGLGSKSGFYSYTEETAENWEQLFREFSMKIRKLSNDYPQYIGDRLKND